MSHVQVYQGDSREILKVLADASVDAVVTDPPYALVSIVNRFGGEGAAPAQGDVYARASAGFMGRTWDTGETAFAAEFWAEVLRVLKPGGHVVAFSGTRTYHRLACAVEDAGFEIRDMVAWMYGSGFPKSKDIERSVATYLCDQPGRHYSRTVPPAPDFVPGDHVCPTCAESEVHAGEGSALKPALEPCVLAQKPLIGPLARNVLAHGVGGLNIDGCRVATSEDLNGGTYTGQRRVSDRYTSTDRAPGAAPLNRLANGGGVEFVQPLGRWPANVIHDGSAEVVAAFPTTESGAFNGDRTSGKFGGVFGDFEGAKGERAYAGDSGSAARFFYSAKADTEGRLGSEHPTVKPVDVMAWLVRLVCPPGGVVLDPFAGSGTTGLAAMREGCDAILIEREEDHADDIRRRIAWARGAGGLTHQEVLRHKLAKDPGGAAGEGLPLFATQDGAQPAASSQQPAASSQQPAASSQQLGAAGSSTGNSPGTDNRADRNEEMTP